MAVLRWCWMSLADLQRKLAMANVKKSLLKVEPFKIPKTSATTGQKVVALQVGN